MKKAILAGVCVLSLGGPYVGRAQSPAPATTPDRQPTSLAPTTTPDNQATPLAPTTTPDNQAMPLAPPPPPSQTSTVTGASQVLQTTTTTPVVTSSSTVPSNTGEEERLKKLLDKAKEENSNLRAILARREGTLRASLADNFERVTREWVSDQAVVLTLKLNKGSGLRVKLYDKANRASYQIITRDYGVTHTVRFKELQPDHDYEAEAVVLDWGGNETNIRANAEKYPSSLNIHTEAAADVPSLQVTSDPPTYNSTVYHFRSTSPLLIRVHCRKLNPKTLAQTDCGNEGVPLGEDDLYRQTGGVSVTPNVDVPVAFSLEPNSEYTVTWEARTQANGTVLPKPPNDFPRFKTPEEPPKFDFSDGFTITISPAIVTLEWSATLPPDTASGDLEVNNNVRQITNATKISGNKVQVEIPTAVLEALLPAVTAKREPLRLRANMTRGGITKTASFSVSLALSATQEVLSSKQKEAVQQLGDIAKKGKGKIKWEELAKVGLPLLLSFF
jgi:hypothetical protein